MKRKITLLLLAAGSFFNMNSQVVLSEDFNSPFTLNATTGWTVQNNSSPTSTLSWFQGNGSGVFAAFNGGANDYYAANFNSTTGAGDISNWLISPSVTIYNGAVFQFATRTPSVTQVFADALQLRMSLTNTNALPTGTASLGTFTNLLLDINPLLSTSTASAVSNGSVNGFPQAWTVYSVAITGVTGTVTGRFAFRYWVTNGGPSGANSDYIGVDAVRYTLPCGPTLTSYTTCAGTSVVLNATGGLPATTYSWNTGATTSSLSVSPSATTIYTLYPSNGTIACGNPQTATVTVGTQLSMNVSASSQTICSGNTVTLTATSAAASYSWNTGATTAAITVTPSSSTVYSVGGLNGTCFGGNTISIVVNASPSLSVALTPACLGGTIGIIAGGASTYTYLGSSTNPQVINTPTATGGYNFVLAGTATNGCVSAGLVNFTVFPTPTVTAVRSHSVRCIGQTATLTAAGAAAGSYSWTGSTTSTANPITYSASTAGAGTWSVVGTSTDGCVSNVAVISVTISQCTGIEKINGNTLEASVYPNPFVNQITVSGIVGHVEIYNALGQLVIKTPTAENETINTTNLPTGAYMMKAYGSDMEVRTIKLIKN